jgi:hypothetical protein
MELDLEGQQLEVALLIKASNDLNLGGEVGHERLSAYIKQAFGREVSVSQVFGGELGERINGLVDRARIYSPWYESSDFSAYLMAGPDTNCGEIGKHLALLPWIEFVTELYAGYPLSLGPAGEYDPEVPKQRYLEAAPKGMGVKGIWNLPGGMGKGVRFVDIEEGWRLDPPDLASLKACFICGVSRDRERQHGAQVLSVVAAKRDSIGMEGVAPELAFIGLSSIWETNKRKNIPLAFVSAFEALRPGDVVLLEVETTEGEGYLPFESNEVVFDLIRLGVALGIAVIEPSGDGSLNLDGVMSWRRGQGRKIFDRSVVDSMAIMVGACDSPVRHGVHNLYPFSNYGSRVDCYAWGQRVNAVATANLVSAPRFGREKGNALLSRFPVLTATSGAGAIMAGAVACIQGLARERLGSPLSPLTLRRILRNPSNGTPVTRGRDFWGSMPDLEKIAKLVDWGLEEGQLRMKCKDSGV